MLIFNKEVSTKLVILGGIAVVALIIFIVLSIPKPTVPNSIQAINESQAMLQKQYETQLKEKDNIIKTYQSKLIESQNKYISLTTKYAELQKEKDSVKTPVTNDEIRIRFVAVGFNPIPVK